MDTLELKTISDERGNLTVIERLPFPIRRVYYLYGVPSGALRGAHAHRRVERLFVAVKGSFSVDIDGRTFILERPDMGLLVHPLCWVRVNQFSVGAVCLILASEEHDDADCIRDYEELRKLRA